MSEIILNRQRQAKETHPDISTQIATKKNIPNVFHNADSSKRSGRRHGPPTLFNEVREGFAAGQAESPSAGSLMLRLGPSGRGLEGVVGLLPAAPNGLSGAVALSRCLLVFIHPSSRSSSGVK